MTLISLGVFVVMTAAAEPSKEPEVGLHGHAAPSVAPAHEALTLVTQLDRPDVGPVVLVYEGATGHREARFERTEGGFSATIPAEAMAGSKVAYTIEAEPKEGTRVSVFASRESMQPVTVLAALDDEWERVSLARLEGRRSQVQVSSEYAYFGAQTLGDSSVVRDQFYRVDGAYTYRSLRRIEEFGIRFGLVRGSSMVPGAKTPKAYDVGLNYGAPHLRLRAFDWLHFDLETRTSVTEVGFAIGGGGAVILGDTFGNHLTLGFEGIQVFGARGWLRADVVAGNRVTIAPTIEVTTMPHATDAGVRLLLDTRIAVASGVAVTLHGGYQARAFNQGGVSLGGGLDWAF